MPVKGGKIYAELSESLERMADGIEKHSSEEDFPPSLTKVKLREERKKLEDFAQKYEEVLTEARIAYDRYSELAMRLKKCHSDYKTILEGFYGKRSEILKDFGLTPWKPGGRKGAREKK
ncbi:MAG: hypothetical protein GYA35_03975 [Thermoanaerobaculaceae bacterium]|nr:hypothetical protein [Thermoanaerobaculaceae bacterium]